jgi:hypothetical protein
MNDEAPEHPTGTDASSIQADEDTTQNAEVMGGRPEYKRRRRRRRLTDKVRARVLRNTVIQIGLSIVLGFGVVAVSTYLGHKSNNFELSVSRSPR